MKLNQLQRKAVTKAKPGYRIYAVGGGRQAVLKKRQDAGDWVAQAIRRVRTLGQATGQEKVRNVYELVEQFDVRFSSPIVAETRDRVLALVALAADLSSTEQMIVGVPVA